MTSFNRVTLTGKVANAPRHAYRPDGSRVVEFSLELDEPGDLSGRRSRSLIPIVAIGALVGRSAGFLEKDQRLLVEGRLNQRRWQTPEGKQRAVIEVIAADLRSVNVNAAGRNHQRDAKAGNMPLKSEGGEAHEKT